MAEKRGEMLMFITWRVCEYPRDGYFVRSHRTIAPRSPNGFDLGYQPKNIELAINMPDGRLCMEMHWADRRHPVELVHAEEANRHSPQLVIAFYQRMWQLGAIYHLECRATVHGPLSVLLGLMDIAEEGEEKGQEEEE